MPSGTAQRHGIDNQGPGAYQVIVTGKVNHDVIMISRRLLQALLPKKECLSLKEAQQKAK